MNTMNVNTLDAMMMRAQEFCGKPWAERRELAWPFYVGADLLVRAIGPLQQANDGSPAELGCAFANWTVLKRGWCECERDGSIQECFWHNPDTSTHGWMCPKCQGMTQVG